MSIGTTLRNIVGAGQRAAVFALLLLVLVQLAIVVARYVFGLSFIWAQELAIYLHAATISFACGAALLSNRHVRVDVFHARFSVRNQQRIEGLGFCLLTLPLIATILHFSVPYVVRSWQIIEASPEVSGMPGLFLVKSLLLVLVLLLLLAGLIRLAGAPVE